MQLKNVLSELSLRLVLRLALRALQGLILFLTLQLPVIPVPLDMPVVQLLVLL